MSCARFRGLLLFPLLFLFPTQVVHSQVGGCSGGPLETRQVRFEMLMAELNRQRPGLKFDVTLEDRVRRNVRFLRHTRINPQRVLTTPSMDDVANHLTRLLALSFRLREELSQIRLIAVSLRNPGPTATRAAASVIGQVEETAGQLGDRFSDLFVDMGRATLRLRLSRESHPHACVVQYLLAAEPLQQQLERRILDLVLDSEPSRVHSSTLAGDSVPLLAEAVKTLSEHTRRQLTAH